MKLKNLPYLVMVLFLSQLFFACSTKEYYQFSAVKPEPYKKVKEKPAPVAEPIQAAPSVADVLAKELNAPEAEPVLEANTKVTAPVVTKPGKAISLKAPATIPVESKLSADEAEALAKAKEGLANLTKIEKKELKQQVKQAIKQQAAEGTNILEIVLAFLLPPVAVYLHDGLGTKFWISLVLTILFFIPGIIYALLVVTDTI